MMWLRWLKTDVDAAIDRGGFQSKIQQEKSNLQVFFVLFTRSATPSGIYGALLLPLMLLTTAKKENSIKENTIRGYSRLFV